MSKTRELVRELAVFLQAFDDDPEEQAMTPEQLAALDELRGLLSGELRRREQSKILAAYGGVASPSEGVASRIAGWIQEGSFDPKDEDDVRGGVPAAVSGPLADAIVAIFEDDPRQRVLYEVHQAILRGESCPVCADPTCIMHRLNDGLRAAVRSPRSPR